MIVSLISITTLWLDRQLLVKGSKYLLLTEFEGRTVSYKASVFLLDLWPKREVRGP